MKDWIGLNETIDLMIEIIRKRKWLIIITLLISVSCSSIATLFIIPLKYSSSAQLIASLPEKEGLNSDINGVNFNLQMINTYKDIISKSNTVAKEAAGELKKSKKFSRSIQEIKQMVKVTQEEESQMFSITAVSNDPLEAQLVANIVAEVFEKEVEKVVSIDKVAILEKAPLNKQSISRSHLLNIIIGLVAGLFLGLLMAIVKEVLNKSVTSQKMAADIFETPVLGTISLMTEQPRFNRAGIARAVEKQKQEDMAQQRQADRTKGTSKRKRKRARV